MYKRDSRLQTGLSWKTPQPRINVDIQAADNSSCMQDDDLMHIPCRCSAIKSIVLDVHFMCLHLPTISRCLQFRGLLVNQIRDSYC